MSEVPLYGSRARFCVRWTETPGWTLLLEPRSYLGRSSRKRLAKSFLGASSANTPNKTGLKVSATDLLDALSRLVTQNLGHRCMVLPHGMGQRSFSSHILRLLVRPA